MFHCHTGSTRKLLGGPKCSRYHLLLKLIIEKRFDYPPPLVTVSLFGFRGKCMMAAGALASSQVQNIRRRTNPCKSWVWGGRRSTKIWRLSPVISGRWKRPLSQSCQPLTQWSLIMKILALDLGKFKSVCCLFDLNTRKHEFLNATTGRHYLTTVFKQYIVDLVVMEACGPSRWINDLAVSLGHKTLVCVFSPANANCKLTPLLNLDKGLEWEFCFGKSL
jgi:hypothetical protein